jgi:diguanylate cyclase (GGDEF)-like protein
MDKLMTSRFLGPQAKLELQGAYKALELGDYGLAVSRAQHSFDTAQEENDLLTQAGALSCLAHCHRLLSKYRRAYDESQRSAHLFGLLGNARGEIAALNILAHVASNLGRNEEAVEAALLSVRLAESLPTGPELAISQNYLGIAYFWSRNWTQAESALAAAVDASLLCSPSLSLFQPRLNRFWAEAVKQFIERYNGTRRRSADRLAELTTRYEETLEAEEEEGVRAAIMAGVSGKMFGPWVYGASIFRAWSGDLKGAADELAKAESLFELNEDMSWNHAFRAYARAELAWASGDVASAQRAAEQMVEICVALEYEQLACLGLLLLTQLAEASGNDEQALVELRRLRRREQMIRSESISGRERVVQWNLDMRKSEMSLQNLEVAAQQLEKWSLEDSLTGIANRRRFENWLKPALLRHSAEIPQLSVALIDVDRFKQVNDRFSHAVGDQVLKAIATVVASSIRDCDLAARLAGDEFVIAFHQTDAAAARQVCERICLSIKELDWSSIAPGLETSISFGVAEAASGDTVDGLLHRSDLEMYDYKKAATSKLVT